MFGKGKRLPVFSGITMTSSDITKPAKTKKSSKKLKKIITSGQEKVVQSVKNSDLKSSQIFFPTQSMVIPQQKRNKKRKYTINSLADTK
jgi:NADH:ubiquinone oxidoreductase subunit F (NADH-binding)